VAIDESLESDELLVGAGAAALAALAAEVITDQAAVRFRMRPRWLLPALRLRGTSPATRGSRSPRWPGCSRGQRPDSEFLPLLHRGYEPGAGYKPGARLTVAIHRFQSGVINDYVTWVVTGLACLGCVLALIVR
jgi:hypothetical protein